MPQHYTATRNACKLCTPLGASLAFKGIQGAATILHGSQGCATYIRRYLISHFKEPVDIASSSFSEDAAVFGGRVNLLSGLENLRKQYGPELIGVATTCLSETIGDDVSSYLREYQTEHATENLPALVHVATPSYRGTHVDGFHDALRALVTELARHEPNGSAHVNLLPGMVSPADLRYLKTILRDFHANFVLLPDYAETLNGPLWSEYQRIPKGGATLAEIASMGSAWASLEFGRILAEIPSAGKLLQQRFQIPCHSLGLPIGVKETDLFFEALAKVTGNPIPAKYTAERERLLDAYVDGHKYVMDVRAVVYGEEDFVVGLAAFLSEIGVIPALCASGGQSGHLEAALRRVIPDFAHKGIQVREGVDFLEIEDITHEFQPDLFIGNSKGFSITRKLKIPLLRVGFPIHDRFGGARVLHIGYQGAEQLYDRLVNAIIARRQESNEIGYAYM
jgi:nitrogenase molybdenum-iron protein NifN